MEITARLAEELAVRPAQVEATVALLDGGATVPFIARYRKEATGGLDDTQLRQLEERLTYLRELEERRETVLKTIEEQGKLTPELKQEIQEAQTKTRLEDLYLPYKPKRRTKAQMAREAGLEPLADALLADPGQEPETAAASYIDADQGVADAKAALDGARQILMERAAEDAELVGGLREYAWEHGRLQSAVADGKEKEGAKFSDYFEYSEPVKAIPSHRALALLRGRREQVLRLKLVVPGQDDKEDESAPGPCESRIAAALGIADRGRPADRWLRETVRWAWGIKLGMQIESDLIGRMREAAEEEAIRVFGENLRDLLLAAPAGPRPTLGLDPGLRTGCKVAVVDATGKLVATSTVYPHAPKNRWDATIDELAKLCRAHGVDLIAIGNGTGSRESDRLVRDLAARHPELGVRGVVVNEAGASVYSASEYAAREFPDLDVSLRGAASIARRLQDPLAELVKIEPKSIGVGQYQHDVGQTRLARTLNNVVEDCVNAVGVDANMASSALLSRVAGLSATLAENVVAWRDEHGAFKDREQLKSVPRLGPKAFEQCAGFLRIRDGDNPLDASAVHPEAYPVVKRILGETGRDVRELIGDSAFLKALNAADYTDERFGEPTVRDILKELDKPGRDPRPEFKTAAFKEGVETLADLDPGMILEGTVSNVTNFGAFVDIGVHQDGLVHISAMSEQFVKDPRAVVKAGDVVKVKVMEVDAERKRIGLSMRLSDEPGKPAERAKAEGPKKGGRERPKGKGKGGGGKPKKKPEPAADSGTALAEAFRKAKG